MINSVSSERKKERKKEKKESDNISPDWTLWIKLSVVKLVWETLDTALTPLESYNEYLQVKGSEDTYVQEIFTFPLNSSFPIYLTVELF